MDEYQFDRPQMSEEEYLQAAISRAGNPDNAGNLGRGSVVTHRNRGTVDPSCSGCTLLQNQREAARMQLSTLTQKYVDIEQEYEDLSTRYQHLLKSLQRLIPANEVHGETDGELVETLTALLHNLDANSAQIPRKKTDTEESASPAEDTTPSKDVEASHYNAGDIYTDGNGQFPCIVTSHMKPHGGANVICVEPLPCPTYDDVIPAFDGLKLTSSLNEDEKPHYSSHERIANAFAIDNLLSNCKFVVTGGADKRIVLSSMTHDVQISPDVVGKNSLATSQSSISRPITSLETGVTSADPQSGIPIAAIALSAPVLILAASPLCYVLKATGPQQSSAPSDPNSVVATKMDMAGSENNEDGWGDDDEATIQRLLASTSLSTTNSSTKAVSSNAGQASKDNLPVRVTYSGVFLAGCMDGKVHLLGYEIEVESGPKKVSSVCADKCDEEGIDGDEDESDNDSTEHLTEGEVDDEFGPQGSQHLKPHIVVHKATMQLLQTYSHHKKYVTKLSWSPNGHFFATASSDKSAAIFEVSYLPNLTYSASNGSMVPGSDNFYDRLIVTLQQCSGADSEIFTNSYKSENSGQTANPFPLVALSRRLQQFYFTKGGVESVSWAYEGSVCSSKFSKHLRKASKPVNIGVFTLVLSVREAPALYYIRLLSTSNSTRVPETGAETSFSWVLHKVAEALSRINIGFVLPVHIYPLELTKISYSNVSSSAASTFEKDSRDPMDISSLKGIFHSVALFGHRMPISEDSPPFDISLQHLVAASFKLDSTHAPSSSADEHQFEEPTMPSYFRDNDLATYTGAQPLAPVPGSYTHESGAAMGAPNQTLMHNEKRLADLTRNAMPVRDDFINVGFSIIDVAIQQTNSKSYRIQTPSWASCYDALRSFLSDKATSSMLHYQSTDSDNECLLHSRIVDHSGEVPFAHWNTHLVCTATDTGILNVFHLGTNRRVSRLSCQSHFSRATTASLRVAWVPRIAPYDEFLSLVDGASLQRCLDSTVASSSFIHSSGESVHNASTPSRQIPDYVIAATSEADHAIYLFQMGSGTLLGRIARHGRGAGSAASSNSKSTPSTQSGDSYAPYIFSPVGDSNGQPKLFYDAENIPYTGNGHEGTVKAIVVPPESWRNRLAVPSPKQLSLLSDEEFTDTFPFLPEETRSRFRKLCARFYAEPPRCALVSCGFDKRVLGWSVAPGYRT